MQTSRVGLTVLATVAVALALVMLVWAASAGPGELVTGGPRAQTAVPTMTAAPSADPGRVHDEQLRRLQQQDHVLDLSWLLEAIEAALLLGLGLLLWRWVRWLRDRLAEAAPYERLQIGFDVLPDPTGLVERIAAERDEQLTRLAEGTARNGIVRCWMLFQDAASSCGLPPLPSETPTEYLTRLLRRLDVDPRPAGRLAGLYHEARFSSHPMTEDDRLAARQALLDLHAELEVAGGSTRRPGPETAQGAGVVER